MSSYNNLSSVTKTLAARIWNGIKNDKQLSAIIKNPEQISFLSPKDAQLKDAKNKDKDEKAKEEKAKDEKDKDPKTNDPQAQLSVYLYNVTEFTNMRNQPQDPQKPPTLLHLKLHYLITPLTENAGEYQVVLGKIMQIFAETPVLRGPDLQGSLKENAEDLRITLDALEVEDLNKLWTMLAAPYRLCASYTVHPVRIDSSLKPAEPSKPERKPAVKKDTLQTTKKTAIKA